MVRGKNYSHWYDITGHTFFIAFLLFCILFYKERLFNCDAAYHAWHLTNFREFFFKHERWINYITQLPAWVGIHAGVSLKTALILYSGTFGVLYYLGFLAVRYWRKAPIDAFYLVLAMVLALRYKHYAGHTEIVVAIFEAAVFLGFILSDRFRQSSLTSAGQWVFVLLMLFAMTMTHPVIVVPIMIVIGYEFIHENRWTDNKLWITSVLTIATFGARFLKSSGDTYESNKMSTLENAFDVLSNPGKYYVYEIVTNYLVYEYLAIIALLGYTIYHLTSSQKRLSTAYFIVTNLVFLFLIIVIESYLRSDVLVMIDGYLGMYGLIWGIPIIKFLRTQPPRGYMLSVIAIIAISSMLILIKSRFYQKRLNNYQALIERYEPNRKLYTDMKLFDWNKFWYPYEVPLEVLMLTGLDGPENCATIFFNFEYKPEENFLKEKDRFYNFSNSAPHSVLNSDYYQLPEETYKKVDSVPWK